jgi:hypothetical protein
VSDHLLTCDFGKMVGLMLECSEQVRAGGFTQESFEEALDGTILHELSLFEVV